MFVTTPGAVGVVTRNIAQLPDKSPGFGKLVAHPGRHDRIAPGYRQPGQRVGQRPGDFCCLLDDLLAGRHTSFARKQTMQGAFGIRFGCWQDIGTTIAHLREKPIQPGNTFVTGRQPVPGKQQIGRGFLHFTQALFLIAENLQSQFCIE